MKRGVTDRGFPMVSFKDFYDAECSIQISSIATEEAIWIGRNEADPKVMASVAASLGVETEGQKTGWVPYPVPEEVLLSTRMHLTRSQVQELLPILSRFAATGEI